MAMTRRLHVLKRRHDTRSQWRVVRPVDLWHWRLALLFEVTAWLRKWR